jgi:hypothetical protein
MRLRAQKNMHSDAASCLYCLLRMHRHDWVCSPHFQTCSDCLHRSVHHLLSPCIQPCASKALLAAAVQEAAMIPAQRYHCCRQVNAKSHSRQSLMAVTVSLDARAQPCAAAAAGSSPQSQQQAAAVPQRPRAALKQPPTRPLWLRLQLTTAQPHLCSPVSVH